MNRRSFPFRPGALVYGALVLSQGFQAAAQTPAQPVPSCGDHPETDAIREARDLVAEGRQLAGAGHRRDAIDRFQRACAAYDEAVCHRNLALVYADLLDWITAGREFQEYFARLCGPADGQVSQVESRVYAHVGRLKVRLSAGELDNITVYLDRVPVPAVHFQNERLRLIVSPGTHLLEARAPDGQLARQDVEITAGEDRTVTLPTLIERRGRLRILPVGGVVPSGVTITVDGRPVPSIHYDDPAERVLVLPGQHLIEARGSCRESTAIHIDVAAGQNVPVQVPIHERRVYCQWWFWTIIGGVALAGGVTAGVIAATQEPPPSPIRWDFQAIQARSD